MNNEDFLHKLFISDVKGALYKRGGGSPKFQTKTFNENGVYKADPGYTGFSEIIVEVGGGSVEEVDKMVKEFLQKHFINDVKVILGLGSGDSGNANVKLQDIVITKNGVYKPDVGFDAFGEVTIDIGGASAEPAIVAGLYEPGAIALMSEGRQNEAVMIASWDELIDSGALMLTDGAVSMGTGIVGTKLPDNLPELNEYGFYYGVGYSMSMDGMSLTFVFNDDGSAVLTAGAEVQELPAGVIIYGDHTIDLSAMEAGVGVVSDDGASITFADAGMQFMLGEPVTIVGADIVLPTGGVVTSIPDEAFRGVPITGIAIAEGVTSIGQEAFSNCTALTSVTFEEGVTSIGNYAFSNCTALTSIVIPANIGERAFYECSSLTDVTITEGVTSIGAQAFTDCSALTSIVIPSSVTSIGAYAFYKCTGLTSIVIPRSVTSMGDYAFLRCTALTSVTIEEGVTSIGNYAFSNCTALTSIVIPANIGERAFYECSSLTDVTIEEGVTSIGGAAFIDCTALTSVVIPGSVTSIGFSAFNGCTALTSIVIPGSVTSIGFSAFYKCTGLTSITIEEGVKDIAQSAFSNCTGLTNISIPGSVTSIGKLAFYNCTYLTSVTIEEGVKSIGQEAFYKCTSLASITIPGSVTSIGANAFTDCYALSSIVIPGSVENLGGYALRRCTGLTSVTIEEGVTSIGNYTFEGCKSLTNISIPSSVTSIGDSAFVGCTGMKNYDFTKHAAVPTLGSDAFDSISLMPSDCVIRVPAALHDEWIAATNWSTYKNHIVGILESGDIMCIHEYVPSKVVEPTITEDGYAEYTCSACGDTYMENLIPVAFNVVSHNRDKIGYTGTEGEILDIPALFQDNGTWYRVMSIGAGSFHECTNLISVTVPASVTRIGTSAFSKCTNLTQISLSDGLVSIGERAFDGCNSLETVTLPDSMTTIESGAFYNCSNLAQVFVPAGITNIADSVFCVCTGMKYCDFTKHTAVPTLSNVNAFQSTPSDCEIRVPAALYDEWIAATNWSSLASKIVAV